MASIATMGRHKKEDGRKRPNRTKVSTIVYLPVEMKQIFVEFAAKNRRVVSEELRIALEFYLEHLGRWPIQPSPEQATEGE